MTWTLEPSHSPALLPLQQFTVSGNLNVQSHLDVEEVLVLTKVASHLLLQVANLILQPAYIILVVGGLISKLVFHFTHLPQQSFILKKKISTILSSRSSLSTDATCIVHYCRLVTAQTPAHRVLQCIDFTAKRLNLPPGLIGLLLGLPHSIIVALCRLSQINKLQKAKDETHKNE